MAAMEVFRTLTISLFRCIEQYPPLVWRGKKIHSALKPRYGTARIRNSEGRYKWSCCNIKFHPREKLKWCHGLKLIIVRRSSQVDARRYQKNIDKWNYALCIYDALSHMLRMSSPENAFSSLCWNWSCMVAEVLQEGKKEKWPAMIMECIDKREVRITVERQESPI